VLAIGERYRIDGKAALEGIAVGIELMCRSASSRRRWWHKGAFIDRGVRCTS